jgi:Na+/citrate or Na+/malate symporter
MVVSVCPGFDYFQGAVDAGAVDAEEAGGSGDVAVFSSMARWMTMRSAASRLSGRSAPEVGDDPATPGMMLR